MIYSKIKMIMENSEMKIMKKIMWLVILVLSFQSHIYSVCWDGVPAAINFNTSRGYSDHFKEMPLFHEKRYLWAHFKGWTWENEECGGWWYNYGSSHEYNQNTDVSVGCFKKLSHYGMVDRIYRSKNINLFGVQGNLKDHDNYSVVCNYAFPFLRSIELSHKGFDGEIPVLSEFMGKHYVTFKFIQKIDFSHNKLTSAVNLDDNYIEQFNTTWDNINTIDLLQFENYINQPDYKNIDRATRNWRFLEILNLSDNLITEFKLTGTQASKWIDEDGMNIGRLDKRTYEDYQYPILEVFLKNNKISSWSNINDGGNLPYAWLDLTNNLLTTIKKDLPVNTHIFDEYYLDPSGDGNGEEAELGFSFNTPEMRIVLKDNHICFDDLSVLDNLTYKFIHSQNTRYGRTRETVLTEESFLASQNCSQLNALVNIRSFNNKLTLTYPKWGTTAPLNEWAQNNLGVERVAFDDDYNVTSLYLNELNINSIPENECLEGYNYDISENKCVHIITGIPSPVKEYFTAFTELNRIDIKNNLLSTFDDIPVTLRNMSVTVNGEQTVKKITWNIDGNKFCDVPLDSDFEKFLNKVSENPNWKTSQKCGCPKTVDKSAIDNMVAVLADRTTPNIDWPLISGDGSCWDDYKGITSITKEIDYSDQTLLNKLNAEYPDLGLVLNARGINDPTHYDVITEIDFSIKENQNSDISIFELVNADVNSMASYLEKLESLTSLNLSDNYLTDLPDLSAVSGEIKISNNYVCKGQTFPKPLLPNGPQYCDIFNGLKDLNNLLGINLNKWDSEMAFSEWSGITANYKHQISILDLHNQGITDDKISSAANENDIVDILKRKKSDGVSRVFPLTSFIMDNIGTSKPNQIVNLPAELFNIGIETISIKNTKSIQTLPTVVDGNSVKKLFLDDNIITTIPIWAFKSPMVVLSLKENIVNKLPVDEFKDVSTEDAKDLQYLDLSTTKSNTIKGEVLSGTFPKDQLGKLGNLKVLIMENQGIDRIGTGLVKDPSLNLEYVSLKNNLLTDLNLENASLPNLKWVNLVNNQIKNIQGVNKNSALNNVTNLHLDGNKLCKNSYPYVEKISPEIVEPQVSYALSDCISLTSTCELIIPSPFSGSYSWSDNQNCGELDKEALLAFRNGLNIGFSTDELNDMKWDLSNPISTWNTISNGGKVVNFELSNNGRVKKVEIKGYQFNGSVVAEVSGLNSLENLTLVGRGEGSLNIIGTGNADDLIGLASLSNLKILAINKTKLTIPPVADKLGIPTGIVELNFSDLQWNDFKTINHLVELEKLIVRNHSINETIDFMGFKKLKSLDVTQSQNYQGVKLREIYFDDEAPIEELILSFNGLTKLPARQDNWAANNFVLVFNDNAVENIDISYYHHPQSLPPIITSTFSGSNNKLCKLSDSESEWILARDPNFYNAEQDCQEVEAEVLKDLYMDLGHTQSETDNWAKTFAGILFEGGVNGERGLVKSINLSGSSSNSTPSTPYTIDAPLQVFRKLTLLNLSSNGIGTLPSGIGGLTQIMELDISNNMLDEIDFSFKSLNKLIILNISKNTISDIPSDISNSDQLNTFIAFDNSLSSLHKELADLDKLKILDISGTNTINLATTPLPIIKSINIKTLKITGNGISTVPDIFENLNDKLTELRLDKFSSTYNSTTNVGFNNIPWSSITKITDLTLKNSGLISIGQTLENNKVDLKSLSSLTYLDVSNNAIAEIPIEIAQWENLITGNFSGNSLENMPVVSKNLFRSVKSIDFTGNEISEIPVEYTNKFGVMKILVADNPITKVPQCLPDMNDVKVELDINVDKFCQSSNLDEDEIKWLDYNLEQNIYPGSDDLLTHWRTNQKCPTPDAIILNPNYTLENLVNPGDIGGTNVDVGGALSFNLNNNTFLTITDAKNCGLSDELFVKIDVTLPNNITNQTLTLPSARVRISTNNGIIAVEEILDPGRFDVEECDPISNNCISTAQLEVPYGRYKVSLPVDDMKFDDNGYLVVSGEGPWITGDDGNIAYLSGLKFNSSDGLVPENDVDFVSDDPFYVGDIANDNYNVGAEACNTIFSRTIGASTAYHMNLSCLNGNLEIGPKIIFELRNPITRVSSHQFEKTSGSSFSITYEMGGDFTWSVAELIVDNQNEIHYDGWRLSFNGYRVNLNGINLNTFSIRLDEEGFQDGYNTISNCQNFVIREDDALNIGSLHLLPNINTNTNPVSCGTNEIRTHQGYAFKLSTSSWLPTFTEGVLTINSPSGTGDVIVGFNTKTPDPKDLNPALVSESYTMDVNNLSFIHGKIITAEAHDNTFTATTYSDNLLSVSGRLSLIHDGSDFRLSFKDNDDVSLTADPALFTSGGVKPPAINGKIYLKPDFSVDLISGKFDLESLNNSQSFGIYPKFGSFDQGVLKVSGSELNLAIKGGNPVYILENPELSLFPNFNFGSFSNQFTGELLKAFKNKMLDISTTSYIADFVVLDLKKKLIAFSGKYQFTNALPLSSIGDLTLSEMEVLYENNALTFSTSGKLALGELFEKAGLEGMLININKLVLKYIPSASGGQGKLSLEVLETDGLNLSRMVGISLNDLSLKSINGTDKDDIIFSINSYGPGVELNYNKFRSPQLKASMKNWSFDITDKFPLKALRNVSFYLEDITVNEFGEVENFSGSGTVHKEKLTIFPGFTLSNVDITMSNVGDNAFFEIRAGGIEGLNTCDGQTPDQLVIKVDFEGNVTFSGEVGLNFGKQVISRNDDNSEEIWISGDKDDGEAGFCVDLKMAYEDGDAKLIVSMDNELYVHTADGSGSVKEALNGLKITTLKAEINSDKEFHLRSFYVEKPLDPDVVKKEFGPLTLALKKVALSYQSGTLKGTFETNTELSNVSDKFPCDDWSLAGNLFFETNGNSIDFGLEGADGGAIPSFSLSNCKANGFTVSVDDAFYNHDDKEFTINLIDIEFNEYLKGFFEINESCGFSGIKIENFKWDVTQLGIPAFKWKPKGACELPPINLAGVEIHADWDFAQIFEENAGILLKDVAINTGKRLGNFNVPIPINFNITNKYPYVEPSASINRIAFGIPKFSIGKLEAVSAKFGLDFNGGDWKLHGEASASIPGLGSGFGIEIDYVKPNDINKTGIEKGVITLTLSGASRIPMGTTGLYISGLKGAIYDGFGQPKTSQLCDIGQLPPGVKVEMAIFIETYEPSLANGQIGVWVQLNELNFGVDGKLNFFKGIGKGEACLAILGGGNIIMGGVGVYVSVVGIFVNGEFQIAIWKENDSRNLAARASVEVGIEEDAFAYGVPWSDVTFADIAIEFGKFTNGSTGAKGSIKILGKRWGAAIINGKFRISGLGKYVLAHPTINKAAASPPSSQSSSSSEPPPLADVWTDWNKLNISGLEGGEILTAIASVASPEWDNGEIELAYANDIPDPISDVIVNKTNSESDFNGLYTYITTEINQANAGKNLWYRINLEDLPQNDLVVPVLLFSNLQEPTVTIQVSNGKVSGSIENLVLNDYHNVSEVEDDGVTVKQKILRQKHELVFYLTSEGVNGKSGVSREIKPEDLFDNWSDCSTYDIGTGDYKGTLEFGISGDCGFESHNELFKKGIQLGDNELELGIKLVDGLNMETGEDEPEGNELSSLEESYKFTSGGHSFKIPVEYTGNISTPINFIATGSKVTSNYWGEDETHTLYLNWEQEDHPDVDGYLLRWKSNETGTSSEHEIVLGKSDFYELKLPVRLTASGSDEVIVDYDEVRTVNGVEYKHDNSIFTNDVRLELSPIHWIPGKNGNSARYLILASPAVITSAKVNQTTTDPSPKNKILGIEYLDAKGNPFTTIHAPRNQGTEFIVRVELENENFNSSDPMSFGRVRSKINGTPLGDDVNKVKYLPTLAPKHPDFTFQPNEPGGNLVDIPMVISPITETQLCEDVFKRAIECVGLDEDGQCIPRVDHGITRTRSLCDFENEVLREKSILGVYPVTLNIFNKGVRDIDPLTEGFEILETGSFVVTPPLPLVLEWKDKFMLRGRQMNLNFTVKDLSFDGIEIPKLQFYAKEIPDNLNPGQTKKDVLLRTVYFSEQSNNVTEEEGNPGTYIVKNFSLSGTLSVLDDEGLVENTEIYVRVVNEGGGYETSSDSVTMEYIYEPESAECIMGFEYDPTNSDLDPNSIQLSLGVYPRSPRLKDSVNFLFTYLLDRDPTKYQLTLIPDDASCETINSDEIGFRTTKKSIRFALDHPDLSSNCDPYTAVLKQLGEILNDSTRGPDKCTDIISTFDISDPVDFDLVAVSNQGFKITRSSPSQTKDQVSYIIGGLTGPSSPYLIPDGATEGDLIELDYSAMVTMVVVDEGRWNRMKKSVFIEVENQYRPHVTDQNDRVIDLDNPSNTPLFFGDKLKVSWAKDLGGGDFQFLNGTNDNPLHAKFLLYISLGGDENFKLVPNGEVILSEFYGSEICLKTVLVYADENGEEQSHDEDIKCFTLDVSQRSFVHVIEIPHHRIQNLVREDIEGYPLLVHFDESFPDWTRLATDNFFFTNSEGNVLDHEVEYINEAEESARVWVSIINLQPDELNNSLYFSWGNPGSNPNSPLWNEDHYFAVWHHNESGNVLTNSVENGVQGISNTSSNDGVINQGRDYDGGSSSSSPSLGYERDNTGGFTISAWVKVNNLSDLLVNGTDLLTRKNTDNENVVSIKIYPTGEVGFTINNTEIKSLPGALDAGPWTHIAGVWNKTDNGKMNLYINGWSQAELQAGGEFNLRFTSGQDFIIGENKIGLVDEVRILKTAVPASWLKLDYESQRPGTNFFDIPVDQGIVISNINRRNVKLKANAQNGDTYHWDRGFVVYQLDDLKGSYWLQPADAEGGNSEAEYLSFQVSEPTTVRMLIDPNFRAAGFIGLPDGWSEEVDLTISQSNSEFGAFAVIKKEAAKGETITIPGPQAISTAITRNYSLLVEATPATEEVQVSNWDADKFRLNYNTKEGDRIYADRGDIIVTDLPSALAGGTWVQSLNSQQQIVDNNYLSFSGNHPADVYLLLESSYTSYPDFINSDWQETDLEVLADIEDYNSASVNEKLEYKAFVKSIDVGSINIHGPREGSGSGNNANFGVIVKRQSHNLLVKNHDPAKIVVVNNIQVGTPLYHDQTNITVSELSPELEGLYLLQTAQADYANDQADLISFELGQASAIYVGVDYLQDPPEFLKQGWQLMPYELRNSETNKPPYKIYRRYFPRGEVVMDGARYGNDGGNNYNYVILIKRNPVSVQVTVENPEDYQVVEDFGEGVQVFNENNGNIVDVPIGLDDLVQIRTDNSDRNDASNQLVKFCMDRPVTVYIGFESGYNGSYFDYLNSWKKTTLSTTTDLTYGQTFKWWERDFEAGCISLPGAGVNPDGNNFYNFVILVQGRENGFKDYAISDMKVTGIEGGLTQSYNFSLSDVRLSFMQDTRLSSINYSMNVKGMSVEKQKGGNVVLTPFELDDGTGGGATNHAPLIDLMPSLVDADSIFVDAKTLEASGNVKVTFQNNGEENVTDAFYVILFEDVNEDKHYTMGTDIFLGEAEVSSIAGNSIHESVISLDGKLLSFPERTIFAFVDGDRWIKETNEANNIAKTKEICEEFIPLDYRVIFNWDEAPNTVPENISERVAVHLASNWVIDSTPPILLFVYDNKLNAVHSVTGAEVFPKADVHALDQALVVRDVTGDLIPEIIVGSLVFNSLGVKLYDPEEVTGTGLPMDIDIDNDGWRDNWELSSNNQLIISSLYSGRDNELLFNSETQTLSGVAWSTEWKCHLISASFPRYFEGTSPGVNDRFVFRLANAGTNVINSGITIKLYQIDTNLDPVEVKEYTLPSDLEVQEYLDVELNGSFPVTPGRVYRVIADVNNVYMKPDDTINQVEIEVAPETSSIPGE